MSPETSQAQLSKYETIGINARIASIGPRHFWYVTT